MYRRFKIKYCSATRRTRFPRLSTIRPVDDQLTAERVLLLDSITAGDLDAIRALTSINWNFIYPPATVDPETGKRSLEAWCRTPLGLLVRMRHQW